MFSLSALLSAVLAVAWAAVDAFQTSYQESMVHRPSPSIHLSDHLTNIHSLHTLSASTQSNEQITNSEIDTLFNILCDSTILFDPSRGTCCRNKCSGCTYLDDSGNFLFDEYVATADDAQGGWLAPYVKVDFGDRIQVSTWSKVLFPDAETKEMERCDVEKLLGEPDVGELAMQSLWTVLSPSAGYPRLSSTEIVRAIKGMEGAQYEKGGAVDYSSFSTAMLNAAATSIASDRNDSEKIDYDALSKEELLQMVEERGMKTTFPKMKPIIIEELRFWDANGRQGKRHPVKNTLS